ncbi:3-hydroxyacyl-CoA dehydrogenase family protein [Streptomyces sp. NPDC049813]|uniref:3-hydroxyacyl-CoA dehydrogenase family protein n=1 Tax=Streptomyces sp. NPDC049813 TaxID=3365597 RepID=UPI003798DD3B
MTTTPQHRLAVLGAGSMGTGIATLATGRGIPVVLVDVSAEALVTAERTVPTQRRLAQMMGSLPRGAEPGTLTTTTSMADIACCTAVVEAVTEIPETKAKVLAEAHRTTPDAVLISNTSAIPIDEQADAVARPELLLGVHFMNPPYLISTAETIRGPRTGQAAMDAAGALLDALGITQVVVGDGPGFVINRILQRSINEASHIVAEGVATPEAVDGAFQGCLGHPTGPLATADLIGLDNVVDTLRVLHERTGDAGYLPSGLLLAKVEAGDLGRKTGRGFFDYDTAGR